LVQFKRKSLLNLHPAVNALSGGLNADMVNHRAHLRLTDFAAYVIMTAEVTQHG